MNKTLKKILIFFIFLCIIAFIVFAVELFIVNRDTEPEDPASTDTSAPETTPPPSPEKTPDGAAEELPPQGGGEPPQQTVSGALYELAMPGGVTIILRADGQLFEHQMMDLLGDMFIYAGGLASLEISFIDGQEGIMLAPGFLDNYIDYTGGTFFSEGTSRIGSSEISGELVIAQNNGETFEAWLVDIEGGVVAFVINYRDDAQKQALYKVLDSLEMTQG